MHFFAGGWIRPPGMDRGQRFFLTVICTIALGFHSFSQNNNVTPSFSTPESFLNYVENQYGADDNLLSGKVYIPHNPLIARHPFYETDEWMDGTLHIRGNTYAHQQVMYNLSLDRMILNANFRAGANIKIILNNWVIDSLSLDDHFFVNSQLLFPEEKDTTFYELIYRGDFMFVTCYHKEYINKYSDSSPYGLWSGQSPAHYILDEERGRIPVARKKDLLNYFGDQKDEVRKKMKSLHFRFKKATPQEFRQLLHFCGQLVQK